MIGRWQVWLAQYITLALLSCGSNAAAQSAVTYVPGELLVRYADTVADSAQHITVTGGTGFVGFDETSTLDRIHSNIGLVAVRSLFRDRAEMSADEALADEAEYFRKLAARFPTRGATDELAHNHV